MVKSLFIVNALLTLSFGVLALAAPGVALIFGAQNTNAPAYDVAFTSLGDGQGIYRMRGDGTQPNPIVSERGAMLAAGSWSPDGRKIAHFAYAEEDLEVLKKYSLPLHFPLHIVNADGTGHERLLDVTVVSSIQWSPDSTRLAFASGFEDPRLGNPRIMQGRDAHSSAVYTVDVRTRQVTRVTPLGQNHFMSWSSDGRRIVFSGTEPGSTKADIYIVQAGGGTPQRIVAAPTVDVQPAWSPRGDQIAFVAAPTAPDSPDSGVFVVRADGSAPRRISSDMAQRATWSADARFILIAARNSRIVDTTTAASIDLGSGLMDPTFTPDGRHVIYRTLEGGAGALYIVDTDGMNRRKLIDHPPGVSSFAVSPMLRR